MFCNRTAAISNQWKNSFPGLSVAAGLPSNRDFTSLHIPKITPPFIAFGNSWDLWFRTSPNQLHLCQINMIFQKGETCLAKREVGQRGRWAWKGRKARQRADGAFLRLLPKTNSLSLCRERSKQETTGLTAARRETWLKQGWTRLVGSQLRVLFRSCSCTPDFHIMSVLLCIFPGAYGRTGLPSSAGDGGLKGAAASKRSGSQCRPDPELGRGQPALQGGGFSYSQGLCF